MTPTPLKLRPDGQSCSRRGVVSFASLLDPPCFFENSSMTTFRLSCRDTPHPNTPARPPVISRRHFTSQITARANSRIVSKSHPRIVSRRRSLLQSYNKMSMSIVPLGFIILSPCLPYSRSHVFTLLRNKLFLRLHITLLGSLDRVSTITRVR